MVLKNNLINQFLAYCWLTICCFMVFISCARDMEKERQQNLGDQGPSTNQIYLQYNTKEDISKDLYYYFIIKTTDISNTDVDKFPATVLTGSNRGKNWDYYLVFHADKKLGVRGLIEEWSFLARKSSDTTSAWLDEEPKKAALASFVTGINIGRKLIGITLNTKNLKTPDGKVPKQYAVMFMTATSGISKNSEPEKGIVIDKSSRPIIVENTLGGGWVSDNTKYNVLKEGVYPLNPGELDSVVIDGKPAVAFYDFMHSDLKFALAKSANPTQNTDWISYTIDDQSNTGLYLSMALLHNAGLAIAYYDADNKSLKYAFTSSNTPEKAEDWTKYTIPNAGATGDNVGITPCLIVNNGKPMIFYYNETTKSLNVVIAKNNNPTQNDWDAHTIAQLNQKDVGKYPAALLVNNLPMVVFNNDTDNKLMFATSIKAEPSASDDWKVSYLSGVEANSANASITMIDSNVILSFYNPLTKDLMVAYTNTLSLLPDTVWNFGQVDSVGDVGLVSSLSVYNGKPIVTYYDNTNLLLKFAYSNTANPQTLSDWIISVVDGKNNAGKFNCLLVNNGKPIAIYYNQTVNDFIYSVATTVLPNKPEDWSVSPVNLKSSSDVNNPAGDIIDWRGRCYERPPTRIQMEFTFRDPINEEYYYYFVFNFGNSPLTGNEFRPYNHVYGDNRGKNWDCYIRFKGKSGDGIDKWQYAIRKPEDLDTVTPRWTEDLTYIKPLQYQPFAIASDTSVSGSKIVLTLDLQKFVTPQGSLPENFMFDVMTAKHPIENVDTQWTAYDARVFDYLSQPIVITYDPNIDYKEETFKYEDPDTNSYNAPAPADIIDWRVRVW